jgi:myosin heavy subunit
VLSLLDEECALPKGSDEAYVQKMHDLFDGLDVYSKPYTAAQQTPNTVASRLPCTNTWPP